MKLYEYNYSRRRVTQKEMEASANNIAVLLERFLAASSPSDVQAWGSHLQCVRDIGLAYYSLLLEQGLEPAEAGAKTIETLAPAALRYDALSTLLTGQAQTQVEYIASSLQEIADKVPSEWTIYIYNNE